MDSKDLRAFTKQIETELVGGESESDLYEKLNTNYPEPREWILQRAPIWVGEVLVAILIRPRKD